MLLPQIVEADLGLYFHLLLFSLIGVLVLNYTYKYAEQTYAEIYKKPFFVNFVLVTNSLTKSQRSVIKRSFSFYNKLSERERKLFEHRVLNFISVKNFVGRQELAITEEMKLLISATAVMLTFGFRKYNLPIINTILVYPESFKSVINDNMHKGEVNPKLGILALSWKDFLEGFDINNDNLNLGIHEFGHAVHLNSHMRSDVSSQIFIDNFKALKKYLKNNEMKRQQLVSAKYFRAYAYTNEFEFVAVLIECFFETPEEFRSNFPNLYQHIKDMLNFNFANY